MGYIEQIEKYINGELRGKELEQFEDKLKQSQNLSRDVALFRDMNGFLLSRQAEIAQFMETGTAIHQTLIDDERDRTENLGTQDQINRISAYIGQSEENSQLAWLHTEAILYPEMVDEILGNVDIDRFNSGRLSPDECLILYENLCTVYNSFNSINRSIDEFLMDKDYAGNRSRRYLYSSGPGVTKVVKLDQKKPTQRTGKVRWAVAASFALLLAASSIVMLTVNRAPQGDQLYSQYFMPYQADMTQRDGGIENNSFANGMDFFANKNFNEAITILGNVETGDKNYVASLFYRGLAYMQTNDHSSAKAEFLSVINAGKTNLTSDAQWYLALCYIKLGEVSNAKDMLRTIIKSNPFDKEKAQNLLNQL